MPVMLGMKTVECRTWKTDYRGDLLICASSRPLPGTIAGHALCVVTLDHIEPFMRKHLGGACFDEMPQPSYAWHFSDLRWVEPLSVKGRLHLFDVDDDLVKYLPDDMGDRECLERFYEPLIKWSSRDTTEQETREWWHGVMASA